MNAVSEAIRDLVAPVAMLSADGLICLALYNRLAAIMTRLRMFHKEQFEMHARLVDACATSQGLRISDPRVLRLGNLQEQCELIVRRARWLRNAVLTILLGIVGILASSLLLGLAYFWPWLSSVGMGSFVIGVTLTMAGIAQAMVELVTALAPLGLEHHAIDQLGDPMLVTDVMSDVV